MRYQIPRRGEEPSQEMIDFLNECQQDWEGDDEGIIIEVDGENHVGFPGDWVVCVDGKYTIESESDYV